MLNNNIYISIIQKTSLFFALMISFWIPELRFILSYFIGIWILLSILQLNFINRFKQTVNSKYKIFIFFSQLVFFLIIVFELFFANNNSEVTKNIIQKLSFLIFPILFSLSGKSFVHKQYLFLKLFVLSNILASLFCLFIAFYNSSSFIDGHFIFNPIYYGYHNYFFGVDFSKFIHRGYFSMFLVFSISITIYLKEKNICFNTTKNKIWLFIIVFYLSVIVVLLQSRAGIFSLFIIVSMYIIYKMLLLKNILYKIIIISFLVFLTLLVLQSKRIQKTIKKVANSENVISVNSDARIVLWAAAVDVINENFFSGIGIENFKKTFSQKYKKYNNKELQVTKNMNYNVHNQFLEIWVLYGFFVFLLFISILIIASIHSIKEKNYLFLAFLFISSFNFLFESVLEKVTGIIFFVYFFNFFVFVFNDKRFK